MAVMTIIFVLVCAYGLGNIICHPLAMGPESACHLMSSYLTFTGKKLFIDFYDDGSSLLMFLQVPLIAVAKLTGTHPIFVFKIYTWFLTLVSGTVLLLLARLRMAGWFRWYLRCAAILVALTLCLDYPQFGEAPLFFVVALTPYLMMRMLTLPVPTKLRWASLFLLFSALVIDPVYLLYWSAIELVAIILQLTDGARWQWRQMIYMIVALIVLALTGLTFLAIPGYIDQQVLIKGLYFKYFNDYLYWVEKSPDSRNLLYVAIMTLPLAAAAFTRSRVVCLTSIAMILGFAFYITSVSTLTIFLMPMLYLSLLSGAAGLCYLLRRLTIKSKLSFVRVPSIVVILLLPLVTVAPWFLAPPAYRHSSTVKISTDAGFRGRSKAYDLSVFSNFLLDNSAPDDRIAVYSWQYRPGFPLLMQTLREPGRYLTFYQFMIFKHGDPEGSEQERTRLDQLVESTYKNIADDLSSAHPPKLLFIEDGDIRQAFTDRGLMDKINTRYDLLQSVSPTNGEEVDNHPPFEYLAYRNPFAVYKLVR